MDQNALNKIKQTVTENPIVLYMKGTRDFPQCGFSNRVIQILDEVGAVYMDINILEDDELRQGLKVFSNWPTFPQLYIKGELIGGCDIVTELYENGELEALLVE